MYRHLGITQTSATTWGPTEFREPPHNTNDSVTIGHFGSIVWPEEQNRKYFCSRRSQSTPDD
jgi:hypothetical protein